jgi:hypothetical protein
LVDTVRVDVGRAVALFAKLVDSDIKVPGAVVTAFQRLIPDLRLFPSDERGVLNWSATVSLPTEEGDVFELGPIDGRIACNVVRRAFTGDCSFAHDALAFYAEGDLLDRVAARLEITPHTAWQNIRSLLAKQGFSNGALSRLRSAPVRELRMLFGLIALRGVGSKVAAVIDNPTALVELLVSEGVVPAGTEPAWAAGTLALYSGELSVRGSWTVRDLVGQLAVDTVVAQGGSCTVETLLERIGPLEMSVGPALARVLGRYRRYHPAVLHAENPVGVGPGKPINRDETVRLVKCRHCGMGLTKVFRITEVPRHLLCVHCRRTPTADYSFPDGYFESSADRLVPVDAIAVPGRATERAPKGSERVRRVLSEKETEALLADYQNHAISIGGKTGVLARHDITQHHLYRIVRSSNVAPRQPYRKRQRE